MTKKNFDLKVEFTNNDTLNIQQGNNLVLTTLCIFNKNKIVWQTCSSNDKLGDFWDGKTRFSGWNDAAAEVVVENVANVGEGDGDGDGNGDGVV